MRIKPLAKRTARVEAQPAQAVKRAYGVDYEGAWNEYAHNWSSRFPGLSYIGDEWNGTESGGATSVGEYNRLIEEQFIWPYIEKDDTVLELGVGGGKTAAMLRPHARELICADIAAEMLEATRKRLGEEGVHWRSVKNRVCGGFPGWDRFLLRCVAGGRVACVLCGCCSGYVW
jgi:SAM-dependent methyltransferase